jgi:hypothetical protein
VAQYLLEPTVEQLSVQEGIEDWLEEGREGGGEGEGGKRRRRRRRKRRRRREEETIR